jgi:DNA processing protein
VAVGIALQLSPADAAYPAALSSLEHPPRRLWVRGRLDLLDAPCVAIVGTRRATAYGVRVALELGRTLARAGATVVSGLARGIDGAAHTGALDATGATVAVLGTGLNLVYPKGHARLQDAIGDRGLLLSELDPDDPAHAGSFPLRNRIIAALARVTIVVEAGVKSGALITAAHAVELGRTVAAVPGPIDVPQALGSNELLRDGAIALTCMADALALTGLTAPIRLADLPAEGGERRLWELLSEGAANLDTLCTRSGLPAHEAMAALGALELRGLVECALSGEIRRM